MSTSVSYSFVGPHTGHFPVIFFHHARHLTPSLDVVLSLPLTFVGRLSHSFSWMPWPFNCCTMLVTKKAIFRHEVLQSAAISALLIGQKQLPSLLSTWEGATKQLGRRILPAVMGTGRAAAHLALSTHHWKWTSCTWASVDRLWWKIDWKGSWGFFHLLYFHLVSALLVALLKCFNSFWWQESKRLHETAIQLRVPCPWMDHYGGTYITKEECFKIPSV